MQHVRLLKHGGLWGIYQTSNTHTQVELNHAGEWICCKAHAAQRRLCLSIYISLTLFSTRHCFICCFRWVNTMMLHIRSMLIANIGPSNEDPLIIMMSVIHQRTSYCVHSHCLQYIYTECIYIYYFSILCFKEAEWEYICASCWTA